MIVKQRNKQNGKQRVHDQNDNIVSVPIEDIAPNPDQPRQDFDETELQQLAASIARDDLLQPIGVRPSPNGKGSKPYQLVWGERRLRASSLAGRTTIRAIVVGSDDTKAFAQMGAENLFRKDWDFQERGVYLEQLLQRSRMKQSEAAELLGVGIQWIYRSIGLSKLPDSIKGRIRSGEISETAASTVIPYLESPTIVAAIDADIAEHPEHWTTNAAVHWATLIANSVGNLNKPVPPARVQRKMPVKEETAESAISVACSESPTGTADDDAHDIATNLLKPYRHDLAVLLAVRTLAAEWLGTSG